MKKVLPLTGSWIKEGKMDRNSILEKLSRLRLCVFWPDSWEDIGFTEREIWINSKGYGYIACDEPCRFVELKDCSDEFLASIKMKLKNNELSIEDIKETSIEDMFYDEEDFDSFKEVLLRLPDHINGSLFGGEIFDDWLFFNTEEEMINYFEKSYTYYYGMEWQEMDDNLLSIWYSRIFEGEYCIENDHMLPLNLSILKD